MKKILTVLIMIFAVSAVCSANNTEVLEFKSKIGFTNGEDKIIEHKFLENETKVLLIGEKSLQLWSVENAKLLYSVPHDFSQFSPGGFISTYFLLGVPKMLVWRPYVVEPHGKWIITVERLGTNKLRSAVVRDLQTLKQLAVLDLPNVSIDYAAYDEQKNEIMTFGIDKLDAAFASWRENDFSRKELVSVKDYKWHQTIRNDQKILVGSGDTKFLWTGYDKQGDTLTLRDVKTGAIEKEFTAENLKPETSLQKTTVSPDEKFLISKRNDRIFVWEIDTGGKPKFEISNPNPKGDLSLKEIIEGKFIVVKIDGQIRIYDVAGNGTPLFALAPQNAKEDLSFSQLINERFVVIKADNKVRVYDTQNGIALKYELASDNPKDTLEYVSATEDGKYISVRDDRKVFVIETAGSGKPLYEIVRDSESERLYGAFFFRDKDLLTVARYNNKEKKAPRTEFYDIETGKIKLVVPFGVGYDARFTPDDKYLFEKNIGSFIVWNMTTKKYYDINLATYTERIYDPATMKETSGETYNAEDVEFSPDYRYILRHGDRVTAVFDTESGQQLQTLYDPERVKYDKNNQIKKSGLGEAGWISNGKYIYALEPGNFFGTRRTISLWQLKK